MSNLNEGAWLTRQFTKIQRWGVRPHTTPRSVVKNWFGQWLTPIQNNCITEGNKSQGMIAQFDLYDNTHIRLLITVIRYLVYLI